MRWLIWLLGLAVLAVALTLLARLNTGYVLMVLPGSRVEISLNFALLLLALGFFALYFFARLLSIAIELPGRVAAMRASRAREAGRNALNTALHNFFAGRYARAEKSALQAAELGESRDIALLVAARAAHELRAAIRRDTHLAALQDDAQQPDAAKAVSTAQMLLEERRPDEALAALAALPQRHTAAVRLELRARQRLGQWDLTPALIDQLEKRGVFSTDQADVERNHAWRQVLERAAGDVAVLDAAWKRLPERLRRETVVAAAAAAAFHAQGRCADAQTIIENSLEHEWDSGLVSLYGECRGDNTLRQIESAERWLKAHREDGALLLALGRLCAQQQLWGKAQSYIEASLSLEPTYSAHLELAQLHDRLERVEQARIHYRASLELAVAQLKRASGGRRRSTV